MTIAMLALAGFPATAGFFGKIYLINAAVDNGYAWLGIVIVLGSAVSLAYYLRVVAAVWMRSPSEAPAPVVRARPVIAGGSAEADEEDRAAGREPGASLDGRRADFDDLRAGAAHAAPARGRVRRGRVRAGDARLRRLPRAAVRRRQGRRRRDPVAALAPGGNFRAPPYGGVRSHPPPARRHSNTSPPSPSWRRVRRRRAGGGRTRDPGAVADQARAVHRRRRHLHVRRRPPGRAPACPLKSDTSGGEG